MDAPTPARTGGPCAHTRTRLIAKDKDAEYVECLDCGELLEGEERKEPPEFNESLSDA